MEKLLIGTRGSALSIAQTNIVVKKIAYAYPEIECELVRIKTMNEKIDRTKEKATDKDIYTKEIDAALLDGSIDIAVHSLKDLKNELDKGIALAAVPDRASPFDFLAIRKGIDENAVTKVGTSSMRRAVQIKNILKNAAVEEMHGNVDTRLKALESGRVDALVLASAGIARLGYEIKGRELGIGEMVPAIGQGALAITARSADKYAIRIAKGINDPKAEAEAKAERAFGMVFGIGCNVPIGALALSGNDTIAITGFLSDMRGRMQIKKSISGPAADPEALGRRLGKLMAEDGGNDIIAESGK